MNIEKSIRVGGMSCVRCSAAVENALMAQEGVISCSVSYANGRAEVCFDDEKTNIKTLEKAIKKAGYEVLADVKTARKREFKRSVALFCFSLFFSLPFFVAMLFMLIGKHIPFMHNGLQQLIFATPVQLVAGWRFYRGAVNGIKNKSPNMDLLVALGTTASFAYSVYSLLSGGSVFYFESSAMIITLVLLGKMLESRAKAKTGEAIEKLMDLAPKNATVLRNGCEITVSASQILKGDIVMVRPGEAVPADGVLTEGEAYIDESMLTGESMPVGKKKGDKVFGGTVNGKSSFCFSAESVGVDTLLYGIIRMVENAQSSKAKIQNTADKVSAIFVPAVTLISVVTFAVTYFVSKSVQQALDSAVAVLVIACPCSLGLATPTALMVGIGRGASMGILIKNADALEHACKIKALVLDKTGTVTAGKPSVTALEPLNDESDYALKLVAAAELRSEHPIGAVISELYKGELPSVNSFETVVGNGVRANVDGKDVIVGKPEWIERECNANIENRISGLRSGGNTVTVAAINKIPVIAFAVSDPVRADSAQVVKRLKSLGIKTVLVSGDNADAVKATAAATGIEEYVANALPEGKVNEIKRLKNEIGVTAMVGDGINDAPALTAADIGFAVGSGTDIAIESGDIVLASGGVSSVADAIMLSRATMRKIKQNLFWAFFYNTVGIPLAAFGLLNPIVAGAAMAFSSVSVVTNSLLLKRVKI